MEKVFVAFLVMCVIAKATDEHRQDAVASNSTVPSATNKSDAVVVSIANSFTPVRCNSADQVIRNQIIEESECREPKDVLVPLKPCASYEKITPDQVWLKRCEGHCDYFVPGFICMPTETIIRQIPIRILDVNTDREKCSTYEVEEHLSCGCCSVSDGTCLEPKVNPGQCTCNCSRNKIVNNSSSKIN